MSTAPENSNSARDPSARGSSAGARGPSAQRPPVSRRGFLGGLGLTGAGLAVGAVAGAGIGGALSANAAGAEPGESTVTEFYGDRQAGITTPAQQRMMFGAFDVTTTDKAQLREVLAQWAAAAALMTRGEPVGPTDAHPGTPPVDTGEAVGLGSSGLTITVGFGASLFDERFGLADHLPAALRPLQPCPATLCWTP